MGSPSARQRSGHHGDLFIPTYRPHAVGEWALRVTGPILAPGYWSGPVLLPSQAVLLRRGETWMSISPLEVESQEIGIRAAHGHVLVFGLGMGWAAAATAALPAVDSVTVVEKDPEILALVAAIDPFAQLPDSVRVKLRLVEGDAFAYRPGSPVDLLMPDIWRPLVGDDRFAELRAMPSHSGAEAIYFWGQELEIARHAVAGGRTLDREGIAVTMEESGLPLIGLHLDDYAERIEAAARHWMRGRWLAGSKPPW